MCGRFVQYSHPEIYAEQFDLDQVCEATPRYNVAPSQSVLAIRQSKSGNRQLVPLRWGLVPNWSKGPDSRYSMINARAETVRTKPAYRNAFKHRRCLIPAEGFYEWHQTAAGKQPYLIRRQDAEPFAMAGLWESWHGEDGEPLDSCSIIVTEANAIVRSIHDRMPAILAAIDFAAWLDPENKDAEGLSELLRPAIPDQWTLVPVSKRVNNSRNEGPELLQSIDPNPGSSHRNASRA